jgi:hypothetical protein
MEKEKSILNTVENIQKIAKEGDIITISGIYPKKEKKIILGCRAVVSVQKRVFGAESNHKDIHMVIYFKDGSFSCEFPKAQRIPVEKYALNDITIYRYSKIKLNRKDILFMKKVSSTFLGKGYDSGHLLDVLLNSFSGSPFIDKIRIFSKPKEKRESTCAASIAFIYNQLMKSKGGKELFSKLNKNSWDKKFVKKFEKHGGWDYDEVYPANFANSETRFDKEFIKIAEFSKGQLMWKRKSVKLED